MGKGLRRGTVAALTVALALCAAGTAEAAYPGELGWIAFTRSTDCLGPGGCQEDLHRITRMGTQESRLTSFGDAQHPSWSPDGAKLAFTHANDVYTMNEDGTGMQLLLDWDQEVGRITWSPDGTRLAAALGVCDGDECRTDIHTFDADGTDAVNITPAPLEERNPAWSPDGTLIAFDSSRAGARRIYTIAPDGTDETQLTDQLNDEWPTWAPDSSTIAFASGRDGGSNVYAMNPDGHERRAAHLYSGARGQQRACVLARRRGDRVPPPHERHTRLRHSDRGLPDERVRRISGRGDRRGPGRAGRAGLAARARRDLRAGALCASKGRDASRGLFRPRVHGLRRPGRGT